MEAKVLSDSKTPLMYKFVSSLLLLINRIYHKFANKDNKTFSKKNVLSEYVSLFYINHLECLY